MHAYRIDCAERDFTSGLIERVNGSGNLNAACRAAARLRQATTGAMPTLVVGMHQHEPEAQARDTGFDATTRVPRLRVGLVCEFSEFFAEQVLYGR